MFSADFDSGQAMIDRLAGAADLVTQLVSAKMTEMAEELRKHVVDDKLSGQVLKRRSGKLANSIRAEVTADGNGIGVRVFSEGVPYADIHEYGGKTRAHDIYPDKAKVLAFVMGGRKVFARVVHHPGSQMPERSYMRSSAAELHAHIAEEVAEAARQALSQAIGA